MEENENIIEEFEDVMSDNIAECSAALYSIYSAASNTLLLPFSNISTFDSAAISGYKGLGERIDKALAKISAAVVSRIKASVFQSWSISNRKNDRLVKAFFRGWRGSEEERKRLEDIYNRENKAARDAFINRKTNGMNLSERVWKYNSEYRRLIEQALQIGISNGVAARDMAKLIKDYLKNPTATIMEVDKAGVATPTMTAPPGVGVYKEPIKNAMRLARTETQMAYHAADYERWQQLDFVVGFEVHTSGNHTTKKGKKIVPLYDICDELKGRYPKDFKFTSWHPNCRCYVTSILKTREEMEADSKAMLSGAAPAENSQHTISEPPAGFTKWKAAHIEDLQQSKSLPYFVRDNAGYFSDVEFSEKGRAQIREAAGE